MSMVSSQSTALTETGRPCAHGKSLVVITFGGPDTWILIPGDELLFLLPVCQAVPEQVLAAGRLSIWRRLSTSHSKHRKRMRLVPSDLACKSRPQWQTSVSKNIYMTIHNSSQITVMK